MAISDEVRRKFIESYSGHGIEVMTDTGWSKIDKIHKTIVYETWQLVTTNHVLKCADNHIIFRDINNGMEEVFVKDLLIGDMIYTDTGLESVCDVYNTGTSDNMYDIGLDDTNHRYFTNGILSHNSTTTRAFLLWYGIFHRDKSIAILANKLALAMEQLQQLRESYANLPYWMQPGLKVWNKKSIQFSHNSKIMCAATSPDGIRGLAVNVLYIDEFAFVPSHLADAFIASIFPVISSGKSTKIIITSCVTKDTFVFTDKGIQQVEDFIDDTKSRGGYEIADYKIMGMRDQFNAGSIMHNEGLTKTRKITTSYNDLECSLEHKLWACKNGIYDWYKSKDLTEGDYVSIKYGMNCWGNDEINFIDTTKEYKNSNRLGDIKTLTPDMAYFIGLYIAEGNVSNKIGRTHVDITCGDDVSEAITNIGLRYYLKPDKLHYQVGSTSLVAFLLHLGFDITKHAPSKIIPKRLMQLSKECTTAMLQGIFDGDGWTTKGKYCVGIRLSSKLLINQLKILLLNYGILSTYTEGISQPTELVNACSNYFTLEVSKYEHVKRFFDDIGFRFNRKQCILETHDVPTRKGDANDIIPFSIKELRLLKKQHKIPHDIISFSGEHKANIHWSRTKILDIKQKLLNIIDTENTFLTNVKSNVIWTQIKSITDNENIVYDFSLPEIIDDNFCHSIIYNGIVAHNTPNSMNHFFDLWTKAEKGEGHKDWNGFVPKQIPWNAVPGRDNEWAEKEKKKIGEIRFNQEYMCDFIGSVSTLIDHHFLKRMVPVEPLSLPRLPDYVKVWELPRNIALMEVKGWEYVACLDSGYGVRQDSTVLKIYLVKSNINLHLVAQMSCNDMEIDEFCKKANSILAKYHTPALIIEHNGPGSAAMAYFQHSAEYENLVHFDHRGIKLGLWSTETLKNAGCVLLKAYVQRKLVKDYDEDTIAELYAFGKVAANRWGGMGGNHDDHVITMMWVIYYVNSPMFYGNISDTDVSKLMQDEIIIDTDENRQIEQDTFRKLKDVEFNRTEITKAIEHNPYEKEITDDHGNYYMHDGDERDLSDDDDDSYMTLSTRI